MTDRHATDGGDEPGHGTESGTLRREVTEGALHSEAVVEAVAAAIDASVLDLDPLYDVLDPDALDGAFDDRHRARETEIRFVFNGCEVTVTRREVAVRVIDESP